ncbi:MAG: hypothetical protein Kow00114_36240 [Kiloniellaceae bacterium]
MPRRNSGKGSGGEEICEANNIRLLHGIPPSIRNAGRRTGRAGKRGWRAGVATAQMGRRRAVLKPAGRPKVAAGRQTAHFRGEAGGFAPLLWRPSGVEGLGPPAAIRVYLVP